MRYTITTAEGIRTTVRGQRAMQQEMTRAVIALRNSGAVGCVTVTRGRRTVETFRTF